MEDGDAAQGSMHNESDIAELHPPGVGHQPAELCSAAAQHAARPAPSGEAAQRATDGDRQGSAATQRSHSQSISGKLDRRRPPRGQLRHALQDTSWASHPQS